MLIDGFGGALASAVGYRQSSGRFLSYQAAREMGLVKSAVGLDY